jgi:hypothetical protein
MALTTINVARCEIAVGHDVQNSLDKQNSLKVHKSDVQEFSQLILDYVHDVFNRDTINISPGIAFERKLMNHTNKSNGRERRKVEKNLISQIKQFADDHVLTVNLARASTETGRLFFFKGELEIAFDVVRLGASGLQVVLVYILAIFQFKMI